MNLMVCSGFRDITLSAATFNSWTGQDDSAPLSGRVPEAGCQRMGWGGSQRFSCKSSTAKP